MGISEATTDTVVINETEVGAIEDVLAGPTPPSKRGDVRELGNPPVKPTYPTDSKEMIRRIETAMSNFVVDSKATAMSAAADLFAFAIADAQHPDYAASDPALVKELIDELNAERVERGALEEVAQIFENVHTAVDTPFTEAALTLAIDAVGFARDPANYVQDTEKLEAATTVLAETPGTTTRPNLDAMAEAVKADVLGRAEEILAGLEGEARAMVLQATADVATFTGLAVMDPANADKHRQSAEHAINTLASLGAEQAGVLRTKIADSVQHVIGMAMSTVLQAAIAL